MRPFFITGLPRSRTAWLANFMTTSSSFCYHDAMAFAGGALGVKACLDQKALEYRFVGDSDSALVLHVEEMVKIFPDARWVIVQRNPEEAAKSFWSYYGSRYHELGPKSLEETVSRFRTLQEKLNDMIGMVDDALVVWYEELNNFLTARRIWEHCLTLPIDKERWALLETMRVNVIPRKVVFK